MIEKSEVNPRKKIKKFLVFTIFIILVLISYYPIQRFAINIDIDASDDHTYERTARNGNDYYYIQKDGLYVLSNKKSNKLLDIDNVIQIITTNDYMLVSQYVGDDVHVSWRMNNYKIYKIDYSGKILEEFDLKNESLYMICVDNNVLICCFTSPGSKEVDTIIGYEIENDFNIVNISDQFSEIDLFTSIYKTNSAMVLKYNDSNDNKSYYDTYYFNAANKNNVKVYYLNYYKNFLYLSEDYFIDADGHTITKLNKVNLRNSESLTKELTKHNKIYYTGQQFSYHYNNELIIVGNKASLRFLEGGDIDYSNSLHQHDYDAICIVDTENLRIEKEYKSKVFERIIYADTEKAITYYKGKYRTHRLSDWKVIEKTPAKEIKNGGSYLFETCSDYVFVFDADSGDLLNTIPIDVD